MICLVCIHPRRVEIEERLRIGFKINALVGGGSRGTTFRRAYSLRTIEREFTVSKDSLWRHQRNCLGQVKDFKKLHISGFYKKYGY